MRSRTLVVGAALLIVMVAILLRCLIDGAWTAQMQRATIALQSDPPGPGVHLAVGLWPGTIIFGFYFGIAFFSLREAWSLYCSEGFPAPVPFLMIAGIAGDLVLNNIQEAVDPRGWHGFLVVWDIILIAVAWQAHEHAKSTREQPVVSATLASMAALKFGREIIVMRTFRGFLLEQSIFTLLTSVYLQHRLECSSQAGS